MRLVPVTRGVLTLLTLNKEMRNHRQWIALVNLVDNFLDSIFAVGAQVLDV